MGSTSGERFYEGSHDGEYDHDGCPIISIAGDANAGLDEGAPGFLSFAEDSYLRDRAIGASPRPTSDHERSLATQSPDCVRKGHSFDTSGYLSPRQDAYYAGLRCEVPG